MAGVLTLALLLRRGLLVLAGLFTLLATSHAAARSAWPSLSSSPRGTHRDGQNDVAVIVAIEHYEWLPAIPGARRNAEDWRHYFVDTLSIPSERVVTLYDSDGRDFQIRSTVEDLGHRVGAGGRLWFVFIGHGAPSPEGTGLLVGYEATATENGLENRSVRQSELMRALAAAPEAVAILDACYSGRSSTGEPLVRGSMPVVLVSEDAPANVVVLTAARANEYAGALPGEDRPAFSYLTLGGMRGWADRNKDALITANELTTYVDDMLLKTLRGARRQHPTLSASDLQLVLARGDEPGPNVDDFSTEPTPALPLMEVVELPTGNGFGETYRLVARPSTGRAVRAVALSAAFAGSVTALVGLGYWASARSADAELAASCPSTRECDPSLRGKYDEARDHARLGNYLAPIGAGVTVLGLTSYFISRARHRIDLTRINLVINREGGSLSYRGTL